MGTIRRTETLVGCGGGAGIFGDTSYVVLSDPPPDSDAVERAIYRLEVCSSDNNNKRMKGIEVRGTEVDASANRMPSDLKGRDRLYPGCDTWRATSSCDSTRVGTGVVIHYTRASGRNEQIVGLQLICRRIGLENE